MGFHQDILNLIIIYAAELYNYAKIYIFVFYTSMYTYIYEQCITAVDIVTMELYWHLML